MNAQGIGEPTHIGPQRFGAYFDLSSKTITSLIKKGVIYAVHLPDRGDGKPLARHMIPVEEIDRFRSKLKPNNGQPLRKGGKKK